MKILSVIFALLVITTNVFSQVTNSKTTIVPPPKKQGPAHFYRNGSGELFMSLDAGHKWEKVGKTILEEKEFLAPATFLTISPNPMKANGTITLKLDQAGTVEIVIMSIQGAFVQSIAKGTFEAGERTWNLNTGQLASGVYICSVTIAGVTTRSLFTLQK